MANAKGLDALLGATLDLTEEVYIPRLKTKFTVKALSNADIQRANDQATVPAGKGEKRIDSVLFDGAVLVKGTVDPDFTDKSLIAHYEASDPIDCAIKALLPGEKAKVLRAILDLSGFGNEDELVAEAKN